MTAPDVVAGDLAEFHDDLRAVARGLVGAPAAAPGGDPSGAASPATANWSSLADAGLLGLEVPGSLGGAGGSFAEVAVVLHELGRAAALCPYLGSVVLGVGALTLAGPGPRRDALLRELVTGESVVAVTVPSGEAPDQPPPFLLDDGGRAPVLRGRAEFVPDAPVADRLLVVARSDRTGCALVEVAPSAAGLGVAEQAVLDATRRFGVVSAEAVEVDPAAVWRFGDDAEHAVVRLAERAAVAVAADSLGLAEAMLEATVAYAGGREQFGRPIGSFQAVQHACADMLVEVSVGRELLATAVAAVASDQPESDTRLAVSMAKSYVCTAAVGIVGKAMQLHGGIGYTWESGIHAYLKRAALNRSLFGAPAAHRRRIGARYAGGIPPVAGY